jgi:hypothetical protein
VHYTKEFSHVRAIVACLVLFCSRLALCGRAPEPRAHEVDQGLARLHHTTLTLLLGKEEGWGTSYYPRRVSFDDLR